MGERLGGRRKPAPERGRGCFEGKADDVFRSGILLPGAGFPKVFTSRGTSRGFLGKNRFLSLWILESAL